MQHFTRTPQSPVFSSLKLPRAVLLPVERGKLDSFTHPLFCCTIFWSGEGRTEVNGFNKVPSLGPLTFQKWRRVTGEQIHLGWRGCGEAGPWHAVGGNVKRQPLWGTSWRFLRRLHRVAMWPRNPTSRSVPKRKWKRTSTQKPEGLLTELCITAKGKTQPNVHQQLKKFCNVSTQWRVIRPYKGMMRQSMLALGGPCKHDAKWKKPVTKDHILHDSIHRKCPK